MYLKNIQEDTFQRDFQNFMNWKLDLDHKFYSSLNKIAGRNACKILSGREKKLQQKRRITKATFYSVEVRNRFYIRYSKTESIRNTRSV